MTMPSPSTTYPSLICSHRRKQPFLLKAKLNEQGDSLYQSAVSAASLRFRETQHSEPLFVDPYSGCFTSFHDKMDSIVESKRRHPYCIATKFIDDRLLQIIGSSDGLRQVVLLSDGMDTRPFRLNWPTSTIIFDVSPERVFKEAADKLKAVNAKVPRGCLLIHIPLESSNIHQALRSKGFDGNHPSVWIIQGLPLRNLAMFKEVLAMVSGMITNGCFLMGELPSWLAETDLAPDVHDWTSKLFTSNGFRAEVKSYNDIATDLDKELMPQEYQKLLFIAEQLRFSDDQMESWRSVFQRVEDDGDEEGFEEL
ncbi:hypothetical protein MLD38_018021 [Melastoma candidum]|uniref:Uncharacterized protein n=1 Tax=Melastoma candidum TaxID=119954 RepID=A0ACB9QUF3_9MYRT|nr:hypothetical protein MLD38_018021 [Melastoma candidum]